MHNSPARPLWSKTADTVRQLVRWAARRRRAATGLLLRGACYGAGTGAVSILAVWVERHL
ncbi:hypothetical protein [Streptomyces sp. NPDC005407]|uniref:hypothetical protein n=1 Tax=Streptomyces sp. NPDC005407 TaxID=3155340 RepID=UPI0033A07095